MNKYDPIIPLIEIMDSQKPALEFDPAADYKAWREKAKKKLIELTGFDRFEKVAPEFAIEYELDFDTHKEIRFTMMTEKACEMPCHLLLPKGVENPPLMVCLQGHGTGMHVSMGKVKFERDNTSVEGGRDFAVQAIAHKMAALCVEQRGFGERKESLEEMMPQCHVPTMTELLLGRTTIAARVWDVSRALDAVEENFKGIDFDRVYIVGNSGGGTASYYTACLEDRIKALMPSCAVSSYRYSIAIMRHCVCNHIPHIREFFEMGDLAGLIAPRPMVIVAGRYDKTFPLDGVLDAYEKIKTVYSALGCEENLIFVMGEEGHRFYPEPTWPKFMEMTEGKG